MICGECGSQQPRDAVFCGNCGAQVGDVPVAQQETGYYQGGYDNQQGWGDQRGYDSGYEDQGYQQWYSESGASAAQQKKSKAPIIALVVALLALLAVAGFAGLKYFGGGSDKKAGASSSSSTTGGPTSTSSTPPPSSSSAPSSSSSSSTSSSSSISWATSLPGGLDPDEKNCAASDSRYGHDYGTRSVSADGVVNCDFARAVYDGYWQNRKDDYSADYVEESSVLGPLNISCDKVNDYIECSWPLPNANGKPKEIILGK